MAAGQPVLLGEITESNQRIHVLSASYATTYVRQGCLAATVCGEIQVAESLDTVEFGEGSHSRKHVLKVLLHPIRGTGLDGRDSYPFIVVFPPLVPPFPFLTCVYHLALVAVFTGGYLDGTAVRIVGSNQCSHTRVYPDKIVVCVPRVRHALVVPSVLLMTQWFGVNG